MKIVILSGTMFPNISARSFRTTELAKGLAKLGHDVTLYTILGSHDYSYMKAEYPTLHIKTFGKSRFGNTDSDGVTKRNFLNKVLTRLLYNVIDYPRCEYLFKAYRALKKEDNFDYLITIAHPYGVHWGAALYKKLHQKNLKFKFWGSDCGDPFMGDPDVKRWRIFQKPIEKFWGKMTDRIIIPVENGREAYYPEFRSKINIIPQSVDFDSFSICKYTPNKIPVFLYSGAIYPNMRDPRLFLEYLATLEYEFKFIVFTNSGTVFDEYKDLLGPKLEIHNYIPRIDLVKFMSSVDFLININNKSGVQTPSKLIDYSISKRPILNISTDFLKEEQLAFDAFVKGDYSRQFVVADISQYDSKNVCRKFISLFEDGTR